MKIRKLIEKHKTLINWYKKKLKLSDYKLLWLVFFKGVLITIIFFKIFLC
ncbi:protein family PM-16 [Prochlorococcus marinus str. MIT 9107]|uniref:Protein family PM-16 n=1 Tax=Prochlorococcus marinus str. MIT 9116 TaxID=167544 RepID=A0A0A1ZSV6_PROMR|nr:protein family PM-16 [Prochlorococcus marinus str. MIT 9107]KGF91258.1 protein family PM-16 [Prochlorococcus marinus str. MIT 9116]KGF94828.1 protein family PM-16 [Prochlorococcus marinus str. MIT 9123]